MTKPKPKEIPKFTPQEKYKLQQQRAQKRPEVVQAMARAKNKAEKIRKHNRARVVAQALEGSKLVQEDYAPSQFDKESDTP